MAIEEPNYKLLVQEDRMELRAYAPFTIAEVKVQGSFDEASRRGFRLIADYIFGNNRSVTQPDRSEKIAMTSACDCRGSEAPREGEAMAHAFCDALSLSLAVSS
jgi:hypothetical protein